MHIATLKRLRTLVEPRLVGEHQNGLTLAEIGEPARQTLAVLLLAGAFERFGGMTPLVDSEMPFYIRRFEDCKLTGKTYEENGKKRIEFSLSYFETGEHYRRYTSIGIGNTPVSTE